MIADPGERQIGERFVAVGQPIERDRLARGANRSLAAEHDALGAAGGAGGVEYDRGVRAPAGVNAAIEFSRHRGIGERGAAFHGDRGERLEAGLVIVVQAARLVVEEMCELW